MGKCGSPLSRPIFASLRFGRDTANIVSCSRRPIRIPYPTLSRQQMEYEVQHTARRCAASGREFAPGETYYSALVPEGSELKRYDYSVDAWPGPPAEAVGWWKSQVPDRTAARKRWAPNDVMLNFWDELAVQGDKQDMRYVLTLLLIRRRVFRLEEETHDPHGRELLTIYCPRREATYTVPATIPDPARVDQIQEELAALLQ
jgi:hypothetical protein